MLRGLWRWSASIEQLLAAGFRCFLRITTTLDCCWKLPPVWPLGSSKPSCSSVMVVWKDVVDSSEPLLKLFSKMLDELQSSAETIQIRFQFNNHDLDFCLSRTHTSQKYVLYTQLDVPIQINVKNFYFTLVFRGRATSHSKSSYLTLENVSTQV